MKTIEERAEEYSTCDEDCALCSEVCRKASDERAFTDGAEWMRDELTRWHDPKVELPEIGKDVLFRIEFPSTNIFSYQVGRLQDNGRVKLPRIEFGDIVGWREIHENTKASNESK